MRPYKFFWDTHKWTGIVLSLPFVLISVTGGLLLIKKKADWIQPPTQSDVQGTTEQFISVQELFRVVRAQEHPDFAALIVGPLVADFQ